MATLSHLRSLRLLDGGLQVVLASGSVRVQLMTTGSTHLPPADATLVEEDTHLVLSAPVELPEQPEHPVRVMTALVESKPYVPGSVVVRGRRPPYRFLAIIHDIDESPTCRVDWIGEALRNAFLQARTRKLHDLALPVLGALHGNVRPLRFAEILAHALAAEATPPVKTLRLLLPPQSPTERRAIERALRGGSSG